MREKGSIAVVLLVLAVLAVGVGSFFLGRVTKRAQIVVNNPVATSQSLNQPSTSSSASPSAIPDPTVSWQTYTDTQDGFSFKYPANWIQISNGSETVNLGPDPKTLSSQDLITKKEGIAVTILPNTQNLPTKDFFETVFEKSDPNFANLSTRQLIVNQEKQLNLPAIQNALFVHSFPGGEATIGPFAFIPKQTTMIELGMGDTDANYQTFNLILSTFKFSN